VNDTDVIDGIMWFRRDLRLEDNAALFHALSKCKNVLPVFIFDQRILEKLPENDARVTFIWERLELIQKTLQKKGSDLLVIYDTPEKAFGAIIKEYGALPVYTNEDYEPYARKRDQLIDKLLAKHSNADEKLLKKYKDHVLFAPGEVLKDDGTPYSVYTPFSKKALKEAQDDAPWGEFVITAKHLQNFTKTSKNFPAVALKDIGFVESEQKVPSYEINKNFLEGYKDTRNIPSDVDGTSHVGPHLRFGTVSTRALARQAYEAKDITFLKELLWRDFFQSLLYYYPQTPNEAFKKKYDDIKWRSGKSADKDFESWKNGKTGYPMVDAGMRELNQTGTMHNRVRMLVASFLCKHLLLDWRRGERYFALKLLDYELASNVGNWQWAAGSGADAAPYFRIFNPMTQHEKFDPESEYVKKWVPEYGSDAYVEPIIEHKEGRERALSAYKEAVKK